MVESDKRDKSVEESKWTDEQRELKKRFLNTFVKRLINREIKPIPPTKRDPL